ncbi:MAG: GLPGLI family protein [Saprospiraceae bacterium]|nr:GLPGLI family protein [Saprospiraceae bacterium]
MKHLILLPLVLMPWILSAQATEGEITFSETVKLNIQLDDMEVENNAEIQKMLPTSQSSPTILLFNENKSLYKNMDNAENETGGNHEQGGMHMEFKIMRPENRVYRDLENGRIVESREFMGRFFLIDEEATRQAWKLTGEQKTILGYPCQKALLQDTSRKVEAWFTTQIPVSFGPGEFSDLPGMILEISNGDRSALATKIELKALPKDAIEKPSKGKTIGRAEYKKLVDEKLKEMDADGGGNVRMIIRN